MPITALTYYILFKYFYCKNCDQNTQLLNYMNIITLPHVNTMHINVLLPGMLPVHKLINQLTLTVEL